MAILNLLRANNEIATSQPFADSGLLLLRKLIYNRHAE